MISSMFRSAISDLPVYFLFCFACSLLLQVVMSVSYIASPDHSEGSVALQVLGLLAFLGLCAFLGLLKLRTVSAALRLVDAARFLPLYQVLRSSPLHLKIIIPRW